MTPSTSTPHPNLFLERLILFLMPYFLPVASDPAAARADILATLASYAGRTRAEIINAARIIAFSFAALDTLAEAKTEDLSPSMRLRYRGCANNLNRSCQQNEQTLARRMGRDLPGGIEVPLEPTNDIPEQEYEDALQHAHQEIADHRRRLAAKPSDFPTGARQTGKPSIFPTTPPKTDVQALSERMWGNAMMEVLSEMGMPVQPAAS
jgi:hypothetical protein